MSKTKGSDQILVCRGGSCRKAGANELVRRLARELDGSDYRVGITGCLSQCKQGVAAILGPEATCASGLKPKHAAEIASHLQSGEPLPKRVKMAKGKKKRKKAKRRLARSA